MKETRLSCFQVECQKLSSSASTWKPPLEMPSKHSPFWPYLTSGGLSLSSQTEPVPGRGDAVRIVVCLLGVGPTGGHVIAMPGIRTTDLWRVLMDMLISREPASDANFVRHRGMLPSW